MRKLLGILIFICSAPSFAEFTDNLRWSVDASARINKNIGAQNTSRLYALGLDTHKVFTSSNGDLGYAVGQLYFTKLSNQAPFPFMFDSKDDSKFIVREAHINYTAGSKWMPDVRLGHFTLPFGLEESIATNGRLLDYHHGKNLGTKLDWGIGLSKVLNKFEYRLSYTLGGKDDPKSINNSYLVTGRIGSHNHHDFIIGFSFLSGKLDDIERNRIALDWQYYWGTWGVLGELALGQDNKQQHWQSEKYNLIELNKVSNNGQFKLYSQYIYQDFEQADAANQLISVGISYQINTQLEFSMASRRTVKTPPSGKNQNLLRLQLRYRY